MMNNPYKAFILAAGFGTRLRPYTLDKPKPMVEVNGRSLIWRTLDKLRESGIKDVVVNAHYLKDVLRDHMDSYAAQYNIQIHLSVEDEILDTGGGVKHALDYFGNEPFYVIAGDNLWVDGAIPALQKLSQQWNTDHMDIITLMQDIDDMSLTKGVGDYDILDNGQVRRSLKKKGQYMWTNIRLNHPRIYQRKKENAFSFLDLMDNAEQEGRFYALKHDGDWHHISTPDDLSTVDQHFKDVEQG